MKRILLLPVLALAMAFGASAQKNATPDGAKRQFQVFGVAFYNLENLFDTINNNGKYDAEFSPDSGTAANTGRKFPTSPAPSRLSTHLPPPTGRHLSAYLKSRTAACSKTS